MQQGDPGMTTSVAVVTAGVRRPSSTVRLASRMAAAAQHAAADRGVDVALVMVDIRDYAEDLARMVGQAGTIGRVLAARDAVCAAAGLIAVTPTFAGSYTGLFKMFFDLFEPASLAGMPTLIGATGGSARHTLVIDHAVRPLFTHFRADVVPTGVFAEPAEIPDGEPGGQLQARIVRAANELAARLVVRREGL